MWIPSCGVDLKSNQNANEYPTPLLDLLICISVYILLSVFVDLVKQCSWLEKTVNESSHKADVVTYTGTEGKPARKKLPTKFQLDLSTCCNKSIVIVISNKVS